jgi:hypothetical protein
MVVNSRQRGYIRAMAQVELSPSEAECLIAHARIKFADERYPLSPALRPIRELLARLDPKPARKLLPEQKPYVPSTVMQKARKRVVS